MIRRNTSPTPIGLTPGDLSKGINQHETNLSMLFGSTSSSGHNIRANNAIAWQRFSDALPKVELHRILLEKSASSPEGRWEALVLIQHFLTKSAFIPSNIFSFTWLKDPCNTTVSFDGFASGCFWRKVLITSAERGKTPLLVSSSRSRIAAFTFPSRTSLANVLAFSSVDCGFCCWGSLFWIVWGLLTKPVGSLRVPPLEFVEQIVWFFFFD